MAWNLFKDVGILLEFLSHANLVKEYAIIIDALQCSRYR